MPTIVKAAIEQASKPLKAIGACEFARGAPLDRLENIIRSHHDDHGEFDYSACAKEIKQFYVTNADKVLEKGKPK